MRKSSSFMLALFSLTAACGDDGEPVTPDPDPASIVAIAQATPSLATLVAAVQFASDNGDLVALLDDPGSLTVFAPTNEAFDALAIELTGSSSARGPDLLTAANKPLLRTVLRYHVLSTKVNAAGIPFGTPITTAEGSIFKIEAGPPPVITDGRNRLSKITVTDIEATNGVVHLIDKVILPADKTIVETAQALATATPGEFGILVEALVAADLVATVGGPGPFTVFAPTDAAFGALLAELGITKTELFANKPLLTKVLTYHVVTGRVFKAQVPIGAPIITVESGTFVVNAALDITDARSRSANIIGTDTLTSNGVIHVIDKVLLPAP